MLLDLVEPLVFFGLFLALAVFVIYRHLKDRRRERRMRPASTITRYVERKR